jgi:D-alanyl-D-alanine carboxypeptidase (penicillin-binding protein 5/6)
LPTAEHGFRQQMGSEPMNISQRVLQMLRTGLMPIVTLILLALSPSGANAGSAYLILDAKTGKILASENADTLNHPASLTKMMTLYLTFEALHHGKLNWATEIRFSRYAASRSPTKLWVAAGSSVTVREAVLGMIVPSANDDATAMGERLAGSEAAFAEMMTAKARQLGMKRTVFTNASGLPNRSLVTTARDMSTLAVALMNDFPKEYKLFSTRSFKFRERTVSGHNNLMYRYKGMDGFKTGFTNASGFNLVSAVKSGDRRVIGVVLGGRTARSRDAKMAALLDRYMRRASNRNSSTLIASVHSAAKSFVAITSLPIPNRPVRNLTTEPKIVSSSNEIADIITATSLATSSINTQIPGWQIQVGASDSKKAALALLTRIAAQSGGMLATAKPFTEPVIRGGKTLYRARFAGFGDHADAAGVCETLRKYSHDCFAIASRG